jgi:hypothetical protein
MTWEQERRKKKSDSSARTQKNTNITLSLVTIWLEWSLDLEDDLISCLCLGVKSRALVLNAMAENLDALNVWWLGVFIAPTTNMAIGNSVVDGRTRQSGVPPDTVRCASHVTQPLGFDRWSFWQLGHRTVTVHCPVRLLAPALTSARVVALFTVHLQTTISAYSRCSRWHTGQSGATPDSPVNYNGEHFPETQMWQV